MKPQLNDVEAERMLEGGEYIWSDWHKGYVRARRKGQSLADYRRSEPDIISMEELSDNGLTDPNALPKERRDVLEWLAERIRQRQLNRGAGTHRKEVSMMQARSRDRARKPRLRPRWYAGSEIGPAQSR
jgi:hypothetical protein